MATASGSAKSQILRLIAVFLAFAFGALVSPAQQPKVPAPHVPVVPPLSYSPPAADSYVPRFLRGGLWMTDAYTKSSVYVRSDVETASITVIPVLYLSNGVKVSLSAITLKPAGTAVININDGLAAELRFLEVGFLVRVELQSVLLEKFSELALVLARFAPFFRLPVIGGYGTDPQKHLISRQNSDSC